MPSKKVIRKTVCLVILVLFLVGCGASEAETTLQLTFDGESCTYEGPTTLKAGLVTLLFLNESDGWAGTNLVMPLGDKTLQDLIDLFGEEPSQQHAPSWSFSIPGVWKEINAGESHFWEGALEPGSYILVCAKTVAWPEPINVWIGKTWTIED